MEGRGWEGRNKTEKRSAMVRIAQTSTIERTRSRKKMNNSLSNESLSHQHTHTHTHAHTHKYIYICMYVRTHWQNELLETMTMCRQAHPSINKERDRQTDNYYPTHCRLQLLRCQCHVSNGCCEEQVYDIIAIVCDSDISTIILVVGDAAHAKHSFAAYKSLRLRSGLRLRLGKC